MSETVKEMLRRRLDVASAPVHRISLEQRELEQSQWCTQFERLMRYRLMMGAFRYGPMRPQKPNGYDNIGSAIERLQAYREGGNLEHLVDAANLCLVEFVTGQHPNRHFEAIDDGPHTKKL